VFPQNHIPAFELTVNDAARAQRVYNAVLALPTTHPPSCPADLGDAYEVTFYDQDATVLHAAIEISGCQDVRFSNGERRWAIDDITFWPMFADALGVPESAIYPVVSQPQCPCAPTPMP
jgi:hypothetical protein